jgi:hypothetical protein
MGRESGRAKPIGVIMHILDAVRWNRPVDETASPPVPEDAQFVIAVLAGEQNLAITNRRKFPRCAYVTRATLDVGVADARKTVYTRDANQWGVGFVSQEAVAVGAEATLHLAGAVGRPLHLRGCILRCREVLPGWFDGGVLLYAEETWLLPDRLEADRAGGGR